MRVKNPVCRVYWLDIRELYRIRSIEDWMPLLDDARRGHAAKYKQEKDRARSLAAGLLLQYSVESVQGRDESGEMSYEGEKSMWLHCGAHALVKRWTGEGREPGPAVRYNTSPGGKPHLDWKGMGMDAPLYMSLSHSGNYAACAISYEPVGLDIQVDRPEVDTERLLKKIRLYERDAQGAVIRQRTLGQKSVSREDRDRFWQVWTCKEACGKLTGRGLAGGLAVSVEEEGDYVWEVTRLPDGFFGAVCFHARGTEV